MKKRREIILDFTSLLDVIMIILFFFILFSHIETIEAKADAKQEQDRAQAIADEAEEFRSEAERAYTDAYDLLEQVREADDRAAANIEGIQGFERGLNLRFCLNMNGNKWTLTVYYQDEVIAEIEQGETDQMVHDLTDAIEDTGYTTDDALLCVFVYNGSQGGTAAAYKNVCELFEQMKTKYRYFYYSEIDSSIFEKE